MSRSSPSPVVALIMKVSSKASAALSRAASSSSFGRSTRSILLRTASFGLPRLAERGQDRLRLFGQARLARLLPGVDHEHERRRRRPPRSRRRRPSPGRGGAWARTGRACRRTRSAPRPWSSTPRTVERVVCALRVTIETFSPTSALMRVDFPALGAPMRATKPQRVVAHVAPQRSRKACAAACSAARFELAAPSSGSKPSSTTRITKWGACAGPLRSTSS